MRQYSQRRLLCFVFAVGVCFSDLSFAAEEGFPPIKCTDNHEQCKSWSDYGKCIETPDYMWKNCCDSCMKEIFGVEEQMVDKKYPEETQQIIKDTYIYLERPDIDRRTCKNKSDQCAYWKFLGECEKNPHFMNMDCAAACQSCHENSSLSKAQPKENSVNTGCDNEFRKLVENEQVFGNVLISVHRNSEPESCGSVKGSSNDTSESLFTSALRQSVQSLVDKKTSCSSQYFDRFKVEALMTNALGNLLPSPSCSDNKNPEGSFFDYCDLGPDRTAIQHDHDKLVRIGEKLPCRFFTREGLRIDSFRQLVDLSWTATKNMGACDPEETTCSPEVHLYAVSAGRQFMFPTSYVGEEFHLPHVIGGDGKNGLTLKVLATSPRLFEISNLVNLDEAEYFLDRIKAETHPDRRFNRAMIGSNHINGTRTGESGFIYDGKTTLEVGLRVFNLLGFDKASEATADGLQIVKYSENQAYHPHLDYQVRPNTTRYNYDSAGKGGNRYATALFYLNDLGEGHGGETVFPESWPTHQPEEEHVDLDKALEALRASGDASGLKQGSMEEEMVAQCRSKLAVKPKKGKAIMFYSQLPDGSPDQSSLHGGCPVLSGVKYAANLWIWSLPRNGFRGAPVNTHVTLTPKVLHKDPNPMK